MSNKIVTDDCISSFISKHYGKTSISGIGDGTVTGAISTLNSKLKFSSWNNYTSNIASDFKTSGDRFVVWHKMGCIVVISFYLIANKDFSTWTDHPITSSQCLPVPVLGMSSVDSVYLGTCWTQANTTQFPLVQINNMGNVRIRTMNASYKSGETFRGTFCYITAE